MSKIAKPNGLTLSKSRISLTARKLWNFLALKSRNQLDYNKMYSCTLSEVYSYMTWTSRNTPYVKRELQSLVNSSIEFVEFGAKTRQPWLVCALLASVSFNGDLIEWEYPRKLVAKMMKKEKYALIDMTLNSQFTNVGKMALYEYLMSYKNFASTPLISVEDWVNICIADKKTFAMWKYLNIDYFKPLFEKLKIEVGLKCSLEYKKTGREIVAVKVKFSQMTAKERLQFYTGTSKALL